MRVSGAIIFAVLSTSLIVGCEMEKSSDPVKRSELIGFYIANHNGIETLQVRDDSIWIRSYVDLKGEKYIDSGTWQLENRQSIGRRIEIHKIFHRHKRWFTEWYPEDRKPQVSDPVQYSIHHLSTWSTILRKNNSRIRIIVPSGGSHSKFYEKIEVDSTEF